MKLILAIIRIAKMQETKIALQEAGLPSFTAMPVLGRGKGHGDLEKAELYAPEHQELISTTPRLKSKRMITLMVTDEKKDLAVETIIKTNQTGQSGDGKVFVIDSSDSVHIRTGEKGDKTLD
ncbi:Nitrogen regulatory protein P-II [bioreactor metagenome]|jgi:nitrogen regulatory protein PII 2|uniref:Nitrogen regulatory protein P-II n=3 Tax=root TaxID=1 RepID=A0A069CZ75_9BACE|nr:MULTISPECIES: P-II family nitrogen regulator [Bacteroides]MBP9578696.1 P-II family nitrogen regulator [Parabacteroides sp.]MBP6937537.1 P-II family nitrogen regulator [Bacteroides sp.]MDD3210288.1 P-II family nitrogen regulator [Bacteroides graminisolvens]MEA4886272.1 P-II family nitrogen regulator [Bacteroides graminisolvens]GAK35366.1 nitrogen regulatory protein P-II [Bacteroides graminisolvens DSM 19988 = JCM 15093]